MLVGRLIFLFSKDLSLRIAYRGDVKTLLDAYKRGTPIDITDKFMKTPLMVGMYSELMEICSSFKLIRSFLACAHGDLKTVQFLLKCG